LGSTNLADTTVGGTLIVGTTVIGEDGSIEGLAGLRFQPNALANVEFEGGKLLIARDGSIVTQGSVTAAKVSAGSFSVLGAGKTVGSGMIPAGELSVAISAPTLTSSLDHVFLTATSKTDGQALILTDKQPGKGFAVSVEKPVDHNITFDWWIVKEE
jgi:hypothetical protein